MNDKELGKFIKKNQKKVERIRQLRYEGRLLTDKQKDSIVKWIRDLTNPDYDGDWTLGGTCSLLTIPQERLSEVAGYYGCKVDVVKEIQKELIDEVEQKRIEGKTW